MTERLKEVVRAYQGKAAVVHADFKAIENDPRTGRPSKELQEALQKAQGELNAYINSLSEDDAIYVVNFGHEPV